MRSLGLIVLALGLLTLEGAVCHLLQVELLRPDPVLALVVLLATRPLASGVLTTFALGFAADAFAGTPLGMLTCLYLVIWAMVRGVQAFVLSDRPGVQYVLLLAAGVVFNLLLAVMVLSLAGGDDLAGSIVAWMLPLAILNLLVAVPVWALARRILGQVRPERALAMR